MLKMYLCGSIKLWKSDFKDRYSPLFKNYISLFEPGTMDIPQHQMDIYPDIALYDMEQIRAADGLLVYMKRYDSDYDTDGPVGTDSSWECGYGHGLKKPTISIIEDFEHLKYFQMQWMVTFALSKFITKDLQVFNFINNDTRLKTVGCILYSDSEPEQSLEIVLSKFLREQISVSI